METATDGRTPPSKIAQTLQNKVTQRGDSIVELSLLSPVLLVFLRHSGCPFCREALHDLARQRRGIEGTGTRIVLVHMGDTRPLEKLLAKHELSSVDRISDPSRELYQAFGLRQGSWRQLFGLKVLWRAVMQGVLLRHGFGPIRADSAQLPGAFWIDNCAIKRRHRHQSSADRPGYANLCEPEMSQAEASTE